MERISTMATSRLVLGANQRTMAKMSEYQLQLADGKRIHKPSDDPIAVRQTIRLKSSSTSLGDNMTTIDKSLGFLYAADSAFSTMTSTLQEVKGLAVQGATDSQTPESRHTIAQQVDRALEFMIATANSSHDGRYLFSGTATTTKPFEMAVDGTSVTYMGTQDEVEVDISPVSRARITQNGASVMQQPSDVFDTLIRLRDALEANDGEAVRSLIGDVDVAHTQVTNAYGDLGGRAARLEATRNQLADMQIQLDEQVSQLEDVDLAEVITKFQQAEVALQAGLQSGARVLQTSLLDYI